MSQEAESIRSDLVMDTRACCLIRRTLFLRSILTILLFSSITTCPSVNGGAAGMGATSVCLSGKALRPSTGLCGILVIVEHQVRFVLSTVSRSD